MVWKGSKELGVGIAVAESGNVYVVANYFPAGNRDRQFLAKVLPPVSGPTSNDDEVRLTIMDHESSEEEDEN